MPSETSSIKVVQRRRTFQIERLCEADPRKQRAFFSSPRTLSHMNNNIDDDNNNQNTPVDFER